MIITTKINVRKVSFYNIRGKSQKKKKTRRKLWEGQEFEKREMRKIP